MGVVVRSNVGGTGFLGLRIYWRGRDEYVGTKLRDDGPSGRQRARLETKARQIEERLEDGQELHEALQAVLGDCPPRLIPRPAMEPKRIEIGDHVEDWIKAIRETERKSYWRKGTGYARNVILPIVGKHTLLADINRASVRSLHDAVSRRRHRGKVITARTGRNIMMYAHAILIDAMERYGIPVEDPWPAKLRWSKGKGAAAQRPGGDADPDPFTEKERDAILAWYREKRPRWFLWMAFLFMAGTRPSEAAALRESDVDLETGDVRINKSRDEGEENAPKTRLSKRRFRMLPELRDLINEVRPRMIKRKPDAYFFTGLHGEPVYTRDFAEDHGFYDCLTALKIRTRRLYCSRDTSISLQLTRGANPWGVAKYHGTSVDIIERSYGAFIPEHGIDPVFLKDANRNPDRKKIAESSPNAS